MLTKPTIKEDIVNPLLLLGNKRIRSDIERRRIRCDLLEFKLRQLMLVVEEYSKVDSQIGLPFYGKFI